MPVPSLDRRGDGAVVGDVRDRPCFAVADEFVGGGDESSVVSPGDDDFTDAGKFVAGDRCQGVGVDVTGIGACALDGLVDAVDVIVARRGDGEGLAGGVRRAPLVGDDGELFVKGAGDDPAMGEVVVERAAVAAAELEGRSGFPWLVEAVDAVEFMHASGEGEFVEHAAASDSLELVRGRRQAQRASRCFRRGG